MTIRNSVLALTLALLPIALGAQSLRVEPTPAAASAPTPIPALVLYSGAAVTPDGNPLGGETYINFLIFKEEHGGTPLWTEGQRALLDSIGRYSVQLGAASPSGLPSDLFSTGEARWLEVQVPGQPVQPRALLVSVPYALKAGDAATLGGLPASAFALAADRAVTNTGVASAITSDAVSTVTTTGGTTGYIPKFTGTSTIANSLIFDTGTTVGIGVGATPNSGVKLDIGGGMIVRGNTIVSRTGNATASQGYPSWEFRFTANAYNSSTKASDNPFFAMQSEPTGNNTASPSATFNLLFSNNGAAPAETGFYINPNGTLHFASGQGFPSGSTAVAHDATLMGDGTSGAPLGLTVPVKVTGSANGVVDGTDTGGGYGVFGSSASGVGVFGVSTSGIGVEANSGSSVGLEANGYTEGVNATAATYGVYATALANSGTTYGVYATGYNGISAFSTRAGGTGVYGDADNGNSSDYGVWGISSSGYAGVFSGNVSVLGTLTKSAGTFKIDDPLDPANKYLSHSFVESPDMMNLYNGNAQLDADGKAVVQLPDYFTALNKEYRYQLTAMGAPGPNLYIAEEVKGNQFKIAGGQPGSKVSWLVTGVRQDAYANAHRTPIEELKPEKERGTYLHPDLFGQPEEKGREWAVHPEMMAESKKRKAK